MSSSVPGNHKHLTLDDRIYIEEALNSKASIRTIAKFLCKDPSTISKEIFRHRTSNTWNHGSFNNPYNFCIHRFRCKKTNACRKVFICDKLCRSCHICNHVCNQFEAEKCEQIQKAPYVCNGCDKGRHLCTIRYKYDYNARTAQRKYEELRTSSRSGINMSKQECIKLDRTVRPLVEQGQSPYMILTDHPELGISVKTLYNYIDGGYLVTRNIDLKRKPSFKPRKCHKTQISDRSVFIGRTYQDFKDALCEETGFAEMDTVISARGSLKCILTLYFPETELLIAHLLYRKTPGEVKRVFDSIERSLGSAEDFAALFPSILTDRGIEFGDPESLEVDSKEHRRTDIFYCDPMRSCQKGGIENVHTMLRMILPKGTCFEDLTQKNIRRAVDHVNNAPRKNLNGKTPYLLAADMFGEDLMKKLQLRYVSPDEVTLSPKLLRK